MARAEKPSRGAIGPVSHAKTGEPACGSQWSHRSWKAFRLGCTAERSGRYYGSVDATPLFIVLAGAFFERTGDLASIGTLWPHVERALEWVDRYRDVDGDGFVEYRRRSSRGLVHQGWKDSEDAIFHRDGGIATGAIALAKVQGHVYAHPEFQRTRRSARAASCGPAPPRPAYPSARAIPAG